MSVTKLARNAVNATIARATWGGSQNFLGAKWIEHIVEGCPVQIRERIALRLLSLSPHYFYEGDISSEAERNRLSRKTLADMLIVPYLTSATRAIDYGCGPGYMACAVAEQASHVDAVDISRGVLACAKTLNMRPNITYQTPEELRRNQGMADMAYSFAVVQHLRTEVLVDVLNLLATKIRSDGVLLLHFATPCPDSWRTEAEWKADQSVIGRTRLRYGLNCFGRSADEMEELVSGSGFNDVVIRPLSGSLTVTGDDDIVQQHLLTARCR